MEDGIGCQTENVNYQEDQYDMNVRQEGNQPCLIAWNANFYKRQLRKTWSEVIRVQGSK